MSSKDKEMLGLMKRVQKKANKTLAHKKQQEKQLMSMLTTEYLVKKFLPSEIMFAMAEEGIGELKEDGSIGVSLSFINSDNILTVYKRLLKNKELSEWDDD